ncbi:pullulanase-associated domain-containing protein [Mycoplasmatota bacterium WC30]
MKKKLFLLFFSALALLGLASTALVNKVEAAAAGKVVFHYQKWYEDYDDVGMWVWNTGTDGTADGVAVTGTDDFGVYFDILIGADATEMGGVVIADMFTDADANAKWNYKDTYEDMDLAIDVTAAAAGETTHVYFFSGSDTVFVADPLLVNLFVVFFTTTEEYEENLGVHAWGGWENDIDGAWGTPSEIFTGNFMTPEGKLGKVGLMQAEVDVDPKFLIYAGNDATKKSADVEDATADLLAGDVTAVYAAGDVYMGLENVSLFADSSFAFKFVPFDNDNYMLSGTYASKPDTILVKFSADVPAAYEDETSIIGQIEYDEYEIVGYEYIASENPIVQDTTTYDAYAPAAIPAEVEGRVVFHYQKWDGDYSDVGLWTWGTGTDGSQSPVVKAGVDAFGAVMEVLIDDDATEIGLIPIADMINSDDRWGFRETPDGDHITFDVTSIADGTVDEIHIYYFQGGLQNYFVADQTKANVIVLLLNDSGEYTETTGIHNWGWDVNAAGWGEPLPMVNAFTNPDGLQGVATLLTVDPANIGDGPGIIVHDGDTKYSGDANIQFQADGTTSYFDGMVAGDVKVIYTGIAGDVADTYGYTEVRADFVDELMNFVKGDPIYDYVTYTKDEYERVLVDLESFFTLWDGETEMVDAIKELNYNEEDDIITELVVVLNDDLVATGDYMLKFDNGETDVADQQIAEIAVNIDDEAPEITFISDESVSIVAGEGWSSELWPVLRAIDNRDGTVTDLIYVEDGEGTVDMNEVGVHEVILTVVDAWGNEANATFTINVTAPETGCGAASASIAGIGLLGIILFFVKRRDWI